MKKLHALLDSAPCGFLVVGDDGYNPACQRDRGRDARRSGRSSPGRSPRGFPAVYAQPNLLPDARLPDPDLQGRVHEVYLALVGRDGGEVPVLLNAKRRTEGEGQVTDGAGTHAPA